MRLQTELMLYLDSWCGAGFDVNSGDKRFGCFRDSRSDVWILLIHWLLCPCSGAEYSGSGQESSCVEIQGRRIRCEEQVDSPCSG